MNILVTGGTGFIGSYLVSHLIDLGHSVTILARNPDVIKEFNNHSKVTRLEGSITDSGVVAEAVKNQDVVYNLVLGWGDTPATMVEMDTLPTVRLFELAADAGVKHIVHCSTVVAFGEQRERLDADTVLKPQSLYGATKAATEGYLIAIAELKEIKYSIIRPNYVFGNPLFLGSRMEPDGMIRSLVQKVLNNESLEFTKGDGTQMVPVESLIELLGFCIKNQDVPDLFIIASKDRITWSSIAEYAKTKCGSLSKIILNDLGWNPDWGLSIDNTPEGIEVDTGFDTYFKSHIDYLIAHPELL